MTNQTAATLFELRDAITQRLEDAASETNSLTEVAEALIVEFNITPQSAAGELIDAEIVETPPDLSDSTPVYVTRDEEGQRRAKAAIAYLTGQIVSGEVDDSGSGDFVALEFPSQAGGRDRTRILLDDPRRWGLK